MHLSRHATPIANRDQGVMEAKLTSMPDSMHTPAYKKLVASLRAIREEAGLTQRELAEKLGREQSFVGRIETGQRRVDLVELIWICSVCGADPEEELCDLARMIGKHVPSRGTRRRR